jgi:hypothetical protein
MNQKGRTLLAMDEEEIKNLCKDNAYVDWDSGIDFIKGFVARYFQGKKVWVNWPPFCGSVFDQFDIRFKSNFKTFSIKLAILTTCFDYHKETEGLDPTVLMGNGHFDLQEEYTNIILDRNLGNLKKLIKFRDEHIDEAKKYKIRK